MENFSCRNKFEDNLGNEIMKKCWKNGTESVEKFNRRKKVEENLENNFDEILIELFKKKKKLQWNVQKIFKNSMSRNKFKDKLGNVNSNFEEILIEF